MKSVTKSWIARSFSMLALLGVAACGGSAETSAPSSNATGSGNAEEGTVGSIKSTDYVLGDKDAPVTIVEYASITCGGCAAFHQQVVPELKSDFIDDGKVRLVLREMPAFGGDAGISMAGSVLARCVAEEKGDAAFFAALGGMFDRFNEWRPLEKQHQVKDVFGQIMAQLGVNQEQFETCLKREDLQEQILATAKEGQEEFGVSSTPSLFVNGEKVSFRSVQDLKDHLQTAYNAATGASETEAETPEEDAPAADEGE